MRKKLNAYIDSFETITVLIDKSIFRPNKKFYIEHNSEEIELKTIISYEEHNFYKYILKFESFIELHKEYFIYDEAKNRDLLKSGSVVRTKEFEEKFRYDGPLGVEYSHAKTTFRLWTPVAKEVVLELILNDSAKLIPLEYKDLGVWEYTFLGDLEGAKYIYHVRVNKELVKINDPYAIASDANGKYNYVIDTNKLYKMKNNKPEFSGNYTDAVIYEASIRDFTCDDKDNSGTFLGMISNSLDTAPLDYIKDLGVTHLQLLPTYDFGGVNDLDKNESYNWGYNPEQYFIPSGWYSTDPNDPYARINELMMLIDKAHEKGLRVIMDVVFNHVYKVELFSFENIVPGYFFRIELNGELSNATGCGNVVSSERYMASRFIVDVLKYYTKYFNVSGFRFDLMGLLDVDTLNKAKDELVKIEPNIMLYGEGWKMDNPLSDEKRAHMYNHFRMIDYGFFNDKYRDFFKGSQWDRSKGFVFGAPSNMYDLTHLATGSCVDYYKFSEPYQTINYVECHDNYTMYDYGKYVLKLDDEKIFYGCRLALEIVCLSLGVPFIHAGQEFFRTKMGIENSYNSNDLINKIDYSRMKKYKNNIQTLKDLLEIRKEYDAFRLKTKKEILNRVHFLDGMSTAHMTGVLLDCKDCKLYIIAKNDFNSDVIELYNTTMIFDGANKSNVKLEKYVITTPGVYIFRREN